jgi:hypothetical protein
MMYHRQYLIARIPLRVLLAIVALLCLGCTPSWDKWYEEQEKIPHAIIVVTQQSSDCKVCGVLIQVRGVDSTYQTDRYGECRIEGVMGKSLVLALSRERFAPLDTLVRFSNSTCDTIRLRMTRVSVDSSLDRSVSCAYRSGWEDAEQSLQTGNAYMFYGGGLRRGFMNVDHETGLPLRGNFTCLIDDYIIDFATGHNENIHQWIALHGLPPNSKKNWFEIISNPKLCFDSLSKTNSTVTLLKDSPQLTSPDSAFEISLLSDSKKPVHCATLRIANRLAGSAQSDMIWDDKKFSIVQIAWGPAESKLVIVRTPKQYFVFDLVHCEMLNLVWDK